MQRVSLRVLDGRVPRAYSSDLSHDDLEVTLIVRCHDERSGLADEGLPGGSSHNRVGLQTKGKVREAPSWGKEKVSETNLSSLDLTGVERDLADVLRIEIDPCQNARTVRERRERAPCLPQAILQ